jgi:copper oxidase (laccase) domain-containing protein
MYRNDYQDTKNCIPPLLDDPNIPDEQKAHLRKVQHRSIHEGRAVDAYFVPLDNIHVCFPTTEFDCLYKINDQVCPRFILKFYSRVRTFSDTEGNVLLDFWIQNENITLSITEFGDILGIPSYGQCTYTKDHSLNSFFYHLEKEGPYLT